MTRIPTASRVSAGGVAFRRQEKIIEVALILVGPHNRWQLPKGAVNKGEATEDAALREVREETGLNTEMVGVLDSIEYWFYASQGGQRTRFHKMVHFFLLRFTSGEVTDHDHEVEEARWVEVGEALEMLSYESEKAIVRKAQARILAENL